jgi:hypothetical protein
MSYDVGGINYVFAGGAYPATGGDSVGMQASAFADMSGAMPQGMPQDMGQMGNGNGGDLAAPGPGAMAAAMPMGATTPPGQPHRSPAMWWITLVILLVAIMWLAENFGSEGPYFSNIRLSVYNIFVLTLAIILGLTVLKAGARRYPNNAVSELITAA